MTKNPWNEPRSDAERQLPGGEYGDSHPVGRVDLWRTDGLFGFRVTERIPGRTITERVQESPHRNGDLHATLRIIFAATGTTGVAWNYDVMRVAPTWDDAPSGHIGQIGHCEMDRIFDLAWVAS